MPATSEIVRLLGKTRSDRRAVETTLAALPQEIDTLRGEGYQFVTVTQLLGQKLLYR